MEAVPSMDDLLDELEDVVKGTPRPTYRSSSVQVVFDRGPSAHCPSLPVSKELEKLPFNVDKKVEQKVAERIRPQLSQAQIAVASHSNGAHSPTPSEVFDFHNGDDVVLTESAYGGQKSAEILRVEESDRALEIKNVIPKTKLFSRDPVVEEETSEIHTEDPEFQDVLAYLENFEQQKMEEATKEQPSTSGKESECDYPATVINDLSTQLCKMDVSTCSIIASAHLQKDSSAGSHVEMDTRARAQDGECLVDIDESSNDSLPEDEREIGFENVEADVSTCSLGPPCTSSGMDSSTESSAEGSFHDGSSPDDVLSQSSSYSSEVKEMGEPDSQEEWKTESECENYSTDQVHFNKSETNSDLQSGADSENARELKLETEKNEGVKNSKRKELAMTDNSSSIAVSDIEEASSSAQENILCSKEDSEIMTAKISENANHFHESSDVYSVECLPSQMDATQESQKIIKEQHVVQNGKIDVKSRKLSESVQVSEEIRKEGPVEMKATTIFQNQEACIKKSVVVEKCETVKLALEDSTSKLSEAKGELVKEKRKKSNKSPHPVRSCPKTDDQFEVAQALESAEILVHDIQETFAVNVQEETESGEERPQTDVMENIEFSKMDNKLVCENNDEQANNDNLEESNSCMTVENVDQSDSNNTKQRFQEEVIATVHDMTEESNTNRLTESELQLGKSKPYWIPDEDCANCMLCATKFSLLYRRHHCRACGRVLCANCCKEKATLAYMGEDEKKNKGRVCLPCLTMLERIQVFEASKVSSEDGESSQVSVTRARGVLKPYRTAVEGEEGASSSVHPTNEDSATEGRRRSVVFRDGLRPGEATSPIISMEDRTARANKKKSPRKREAVARRLASLKLEEELQSALPNESRTDVFIRNGEGLAEQTDIKIIDSRLTECASVEIFLKRNLSVIVQLVSHPTDSSRLVWFVSSKGFSAIGVDEIVFLWNREESESVRLPLGVLERVAEMFESGLEGDHLGIRRSCERLSALHTTHKTTIDAPCTKHVLIFRPSTMEVLSLSAPWPTVPFVVGCFLRDSEMVWALAAPNRLLIRLGLASSWYPAPLVNDVNRPAVYTNETSQTVLKVFTDFRNWNYRMQHLHGATIVLSKQETLIRLPISEKNEMSSIIQWNKCMLAWSCDFDREADSHLVCVEDQGMYTSQVLSRRGNRELTGASFVIVNGGLKTEGGKFQVSVMEDGVAIRMSADDFGSLIGALQTGADWSLTGEHNRVRFEWVDPVPLHSQMVSPIDGVYLGNKYQYGLSLSRAITTALQCPSCPDYAIRLSHVFNMESGRFNTDEEAKIFSVAEMLAREVTTSLDPYLQLLIKMNVSLIALRFRVSQDAVEYHVSSWSGMEEEKTNFKQTLDQLVPVLVNILNYLNNGFHLELHLSIVSTVSLPV